MVAVTSTGIYCRVGCPSRTPRPDRVPFFVSPPAASSHRLHTLRAIPARTREVEAQRDLVQHCSGLIGSSIRRRRRGQSSYRSARRSTSGLRAPGFSARSSSLPCSSPGATASQHSIPHRQHHHAARRCRLRRRFARSAVQRLIAADLVARERSSRRGGPGGGRSRTRRSAEPAAATREPFAAGPLFAFLAARPSPGSRASGMAMTSCPRGGRLGHEPGPEHATVPSYARALRTPRGAAVVVMSPGPGSHAACPARRPRRSGDAVPRCRRLLDLDADPVAVASGLVPTPC